MMEVNTHTILLKNIDSATNWYRERPFELNRITTKLKELTYLVANSWETLSVEDKDILKAFAYTEDYRLSWFQLIRAIIFFVKLIRYNNLTDFAEFLRTAQELKETIMDQIEKENANYHQMIVENLSQVREGKIRDIENIDTWLNGIFSEANR